MKTLKSLIVDDSPDDAELLLRHLSKGGYDMQAKIVHTQADLRIALSERDWDIVLSDYSMPNFTGLNALAIVKESELDIPVIIISGTIGEDVAVEAMVVGADDYLMKDNLTRLAPAIERELENAASRRKQKQAEEDLRRSEASLANAQRIAHVGSWDWDIQNDQIFWSEEVYRIFCLTKTQFNGTYEGFIHSIHPEDRQLVQSAVDATLSGDAPYNIEHRVIHPNGDERIVCSIGEVTFDESGKPLRFAGTVQDITERKRRELSLVKLTSQIEQQSRVFNTTLSSITDFAYILNRNGHFVYANKPLLDLWGLTLDEAVGKNFFDLQYPDDLATQLQQQIQQVFDTRQELRGETPYTSPTGAGGYYEYIFNPVFADDGTVELVAGSTRDITERKQAEKALHESEERFRSIVETTSEWIWAFDSQGNCSYSNPALETILGYAPEEIIGKSFLSILHEEEREKVQKLVPILIAENRGWTNLVLRWYHKDGSIRYLESNALPLLDSGGEVIGFRGADRDITERNRAETELRQSESRMRALLDAIPDLMFRYDKNGVILDFSATHQEDLLFPPSEFIGKNMRDVLPPSVVQQTMRHISVATDTGKMQIFEYQLEVDGIEKSYEARIVAASESEVTAIVRDVTKRKQAEDKLRRSEANLSAAQRITHLGSWEVELSDLRRVNNNKVYWSDEVYRIFGYEPGAVQVSINNYFDSIHPDDRKYCRRAFIEAVLDRKDLDIEFRVVIPNGSEKILHGQAEVIYDEQSNQPLKLIGTVQDITKRKRAEEEKMLLVAQIEQQHERLNNIIDNITGVVWEGWGKPDEATQKIDFISDYVEVMLGYTVEEWIDTPNFWLSIVHPDDRERMRQVAADSFSKSQSFIEEFRWLTKDGRTVWVETHSTVICDKEGQAIGYRGINLDITERKRLEEERIELIAELDFEKAHLQHIFDNSPSFIFSLRGPKFVFEMANPACYKLVGQRNLIGIPAIEVFPEVVTQGLFEIMNQVYNTGEPFVGTEVPIKTRLQDSSELQQQYINFVYLPLREADNSICGIVSYGVDVTEQVLSRTKTQESEERYRFLFDKNPLPLWVFDLETFAFLSVNDAAIAHYGYTREEFLTMNGKDIRPPEDVPFFLETTGKNAPGIRKVGVHRHIKKDGTVIDVEITTNQLIFNGKIAKLVLVNDVTERKLADRKIRESEERYRIVAETANDVIMTIDEHSSILFVNSSVEKILGYSPEELIGKNLSIIVPERLRAAHSFGMNRYIQTGTKNIPWNGVELQALHRDGSEKQVEISFGEYRENDKRLFTGVFRDITERKRAETALREAEDKYRNLVESSPAIIYLSEPHPPFAPIYVSPNITRFGYPVEEWLNKPDMWISIIHEEDQARVLRAIDDATEQESETELEYRIVTSDKAVIWLHDKGRFLFDERGNKTGWQGVMLDITKTKHLEEQLYQSQKLESVGLLAGGIAHDFNNMLTAINGYSALTLRQLKKDDPLRRNIEEIKKAGERSADLTQQLLAFSRQQVLQPVVLDLNEVIRDTIEMLQRVIDEAIQITTILNPKLSRVKVDPVQFSQILLNLAVNARDAMPRGGKLTIETVNIFLGPDYAEQRASILPGAYVMLAVSDTGTGISAETKEHIFEPFFTTKEVGQGTGLGLSTVYGIVKQSGGIIEVESEQGSGTTFKVYLPRVAEEVSGIDVKDIPAEMPRGSETILLVEDEEMVRNLTRTILEECGYTVIEAMNGIEALEICEKVDCKFDLLMTDVVMPQMGGRELADLLKKKLPDLKILFTSGYTNDAVVRHGVFELDTNFIQKPFTHDLLAKKIRELLDSSEKSVH